MFAELNEYKEFWSFWKLSGKVDSRAKDKKWPDGCSKEAAWRRPQGNSLGLGRGKLAVLGLTSHRLVARGPVLKRKAGGKYPVSIWSSRCSLPYAYFVTLPGLIEA